MGAMIKNEQQYRITKEWLQKFKRSVALNLRKHCGKTPTAHARLDAKVLILLVNGLFQP